MIIFNRSIWSVVLAGLILACFWGCNSASAENAQSERKIAASLVKVYTTSNPPDYRSPWQRQGVISTGGSGVIIGPGQILTAAHVVSDQVRVEVRRAGGTRRYPARVLYVGHECDLALLSVDDPSFFAGVTPLKFGDLPKLRDRVDVYGFPEGGDRISVTAGVVSRVETGPYVHSEAQLLLAQVDAAINAGNSGGPVMAGLKIVGIAAESLTDAENIGYMIPTPVIEHFLVDVKDGHFDGFPRLGIDVQMLQNIDHRKALGIKTPDVGVLINRINYGSPAAGVLFAGDVLLNIDGVAIGDDETVSLRGDERVHFSHLLTQKQVGERVTLGLIRQSKPISATVKINTVERLVAGPSYDRMPSYLIYAGLIFQPLSSNYLGLYYSWPGDLTNLAVHQNLVTPERQQIVILAHVLSHGVNQGYDELQDKIISKINGQIPRDIYDFAKILDKIDTGWVQLVFEDQTNLVLDATKARSAQSEILSAYGVPKDRSPDLITHN